MTAKWAINSAVRFAPLFAHQVVWVRNIISGITQPYLVDKSTTEAIKGLVVDGAYVTKLDSAIARELEEIGVIFDESSVRRKREVWNIQMKNIKNELQQLSWAVVRGLYNPAGTSAFRTWVEHTRRFYRDGDELVGNRINCHNDVLCRKFHLEFSKVLIPLFPERVKPSYCYLGIYHGQADLPKHIDREQCRWNVSVVLNSSPEITSVSDSWPIYLEPVPLKHVQLNAAIGDAIVYRGDKIPHWRDPLPTRFNQVSICFFHYVHQTFSGVLD